MYELFKYLVKVQCTAIRFSPSMGFIHEFVLTKTSMPSALATFMLYSKCPALLCQIHIGTAIMTSDSIDVNASLRRREKNCNQPKTYCV